MNWFRVWKNVAVPVVAAIGLVAVLSFGLRSGGEQAPSTPAMDQDRSTMGEQGGAADAPVYANDDASTPSGGGSPVWSGGARNAQGHWQKHGSEFPQFDSERDYVDGAHAFVSHPPAGTQIKHRDNGDTLYFDPGSGTFAVQAPNGAPRTMFKPGDGEAYWERQR